ncbi:phage virion morphogenesis protein [Flavobacterium cerinum]|uniref:Phage virion morphogenesis protein n=1 Tax=Flavobacterium cerinum TaxID=2502784 RepID=A0A444HEG1_9FLAO|nr:phage virion morphogenesis protein [Flavobacterium cerinum]RWX03375.1 hypothetical protein EPI11_00150 [Flavobacterium cerinum]
MHNNNAVELDKLRRKYEAFRARIPQQIAITAVNFFKRNFDREGFVDQPFQKWKPLKNPRDRGRKILTKSGRLKRGLKKLQVSRNKVIVGIGNDIKYAQLQNDGGRIPITPKMRRYFWAMFKQTGNEYYKGLALTKKTHIDIPKRQFIGDSKAIVVTIDRLIVKELKRSLG